jgi:UDP-sugar pyrophosphorylase
MTSCARSEHDADKSKDCALSLTQVGLPTEMSTETCYLQYYIDYILAVQKKYGAGRVKLQLCIMTSGDTNEGTIKLLESNKYFGMPKDQITIVQQGQGVPALTDNDGTIEFEVNTSRVVTKPHGHGDIHELLYRHSVAKDWISKGLKWLVLFQDTNGLAFHTLPLMLGVSTKLDLIMNSLTVPRKAKQAIGAIVKLDNAMTGESRYEATI